MAVDTFVVFVGLATGLVIEKKELQADNEAIEADAASAS